MNKLDAFRIWILMVAVVASFLTSQYSSSLLAQSLESTSDSLTVKLDNQELVELLALLPAEERIEQIRDIGLLAAARFMFDADDKALVRWVGLNGVARRGYNSESALSMYADGRLIELSPDEVVIVISRDESILDRKNFKSIGESLTDHEFFAFIRQLDNHFALRGQAPSKVNLVSYVFHAEDSLLGLSKIGTFNGADFYTNGKHGFRKQHLANHRELKQFLNSIDELISARFSSSGSVELSARRFKGKKRLGITVEDWQAVARIYREGAKVADRNFQRPGFSLDPYLDAEGLNFEINVLRPSALNPSFDGVNWKILRRRIRAAAKAAEEISESAGEKQFVSVNPNIAPLLEVEEVARKRANDETLSIATRYTEQVFIAWLNQVIQANTVTVARYDGGAYSLFGDVKLQEGTRYTDIGRTFFYIDYLAKRLTSHGTDLHKEVPGLLTIPDVATRFPLSQHEMLHQAVEGRLWLEPSKNGHILDANEIRFSSKVVRLLGARQADGKLGINEVPLPAKFVEAFSRLERYYDSCAFAEPQFARFREIMKLLLLFEAAHQNEPQISLDFAGEYTVNEQLVIDEDWLRQNTTQNCHRFMNFIKRSDGGTEALKFNPRELATYAVGGSTRIYQGVAGARRKHVIDRRVNEQWKRASKDHFVPLQAELKKSSPEKIALPSRKMSVKFYGNGARLEVESADFATGYTGHQHYVKQPKTLTREIESKSDGVKFVEKSEDALLQSMSIKKLADGFVSVKIENGNSAELGNALYKYLEAYESGKKPQGMFDLSDGSIALFVHRKIGDQLEQPQNLASVNRRGVGNEWVDAHRIQDKALISAVRKLPKDFKFTQADWNALVEKPVVVKKDSQRGFVAVGDNNVDLIPLNDVTRRDFVAYRKRGTQESNHLTFDVSKLSDAEAAEFLGQRSKLEMDLDANVHIQMTDQTDAALSRVLRRNMSHQLDVVADVNSMKKAGGVGPRVANYLENVRPIRERGIGKLRCLFSEAANAPKTLDDWIVMAKNGEFKGEIVLVGSCPLDPVKMIKFARAARNAGAIEVILPNETLHMDAFALATNKLRQIYSSRSTRVRVQSKYDSIASHYDMWKAAHQEVAHDLVKLLEHQGDRQQLAVQLMGVRVKGETKLDSSILKVMEDFSDVLLREKIRKLTGKIEPANEPVERGDGLKYGPVTQRNDMKDADSACPPGWRQVDA